MVGHQHIGIARAVEDACEGEHIDVAFVRPDLDEIVESNTNVAKVNIENFLMGGEILDDLRQFLPGPLQSFRGDTAAKVEAMAGAVDEFTETLQSFEYGVIPALLAS